MGGWSGEKREENVAVAIDKDKSSQYALKWTVDNLLSRGQSVTLIHVKLTPLASAAAGSTADVNSDSSGKEIFLPFRCFCTRKDIRCDEIILEATDISKALIDYVMDNTIETLVVGAPAKTSILRRFKTVDVSSLVSKGAPTFCTVYVIARGKISSVRPATTAPPLKPNFRQLQTQSSSVSDSSANPIRKASEKRQNAPRMLQEDMDIKSPFERNGYAGRYVSSVSETDISFVSSGRPSTDRMLGFYDSFEPGTTPRLSLGSEFDERSSFSAPFSPSKRSSKFGALQSLEFSSGPQEGARLSWSAQSSGDAEAEMRRLRQELKQTMEMYSNACKEAITAKQKAGELHRWKLDKEHKLEEARLAEEAALALAEREKAKCKAALEAAAAAQRIAEREAQRRKEAEMRALAEAEGKNRAPSNLMHGGIRYRKYTIAEIEEATENFSGSRKIGEGGYGPVFRGMLDHTLVAIKVLRPDAAQGRSQFHQEVEVLTCMRHPNMVLLLGACPEYGCLVYEYMSNGSLDDRLFRRGNTPVIPWQVRFRIAAEIATALLFLHQTKPEPLVHRDLKPGNILLDRNFASKISDVGLARLVPPSVADSVTQYRMTATAGTFCYIDPEYQQTGMLGIKSDIYSFGIMLLQLITARPPMGLTHQVGRAIERGTFAEILDPAVKDWPVEEALSFAKLALQCAELRRKDRPDLGNVVLPELNRLRALAEDSMPVLAYGGAMGFSPNHSQASASTLQEVMSDPQIMQSGSESSKSLSTST